MIKFIVNNINSIGLIFNFLGSIFLTFSFLFITKKKALELGVSRWGGSTDEENLKLPNIKNILLQKRWGIAGVLFLTIGFILQFLSTL